MPTGGGVLPRAELNAVNVSEIVLSIDLGVIAPQPLASFMSRSALMRRWSNWPSIPNAIVQSIRSVW